MRVPAGLELDDTQLPSMVVDPGEQSSTLLRVRRPAHSCAGRGACGQGLADVAERGPTPAVGLVARAVPRACRRRRIRRQRGSRGCTGGVQQRDVGYLWVRRKMAVATTAAAQRPPIPEAICQPPATKPATQPKVAAMTQHHAVTFASRRLAGPGGVTREASHGGASGVWVGRLPPDLPHDGINSFPVAVSGHHAAGLAPVACPGRPHLRGTTGQQGCCSAGKDHERWTSPSLSASTSSRRRASSLRKGVRAPQSRQARMNGAS